MTHDSNNLYLEDAMSLMGAMLDYAVNACGEDMELFYARFLGSGIARQISSVNPKYVAGMSGTELAMIVAERTGDPLPKMDYCTDIGSPEYWTGWTMAYISLSLNMDFRTLSERGLLLKDVYSRYPSLHEADLSKSLSFAGKRMLTSLNPLKAARISAGMSQKQLADLSGVSLRTIRGYEQGQRKLSNASAESLLRLCNIIGCTPDYLIQ